MEIRAGRAFSLLLCQVVRHDELEHGHTCSPGYAKIRGNTYHGDIPVPKAIHHLYAAKDGPTMRGTMDTSNSREAERQIREQRAVFDR